MVYGLTKGQASPTSQIGFKTPVQISGVFLEPFNPIAVAIALDAGFIARCFAGDAEQTKSILTKAIEYKGYALVDILQPCVSFNKLNTYNWFKEHTYYLEDYDPFNKQRAFEKATENDKLPLGIFYTNSEKSTFEENVGIYQERETPLYGRQPDMKKLRDLIKKLRMSFDTHGLPEYFLSTPQRMGQSPTRSRYS